MFDVDFDNPAPQLICHSEMRIHEKLILEKLNPYFLRDHFILFSSGTTGGDLKGYALSKKSILGNAEAVNKHFHLTKDDVWGLSLPVYHVGGLSVLARAHLLGNRIIDGRKWEPESWLKKLNGVTITTLVPTQVYDIVKNNLSPWKGLKYVVVGGDFLSSGLKRKAIELGWPVIRTFGMSEVCSQLASAQSPDSDDLIILPPHEAKIEDGRLLVKSRTLFTLEFKMGEKFKVNTSRELCDRDGFYYTKDRATVKNGIIFPEGRLGEELKVSGHLIDLNALKDAFQNLLIEKDLYKKMELQVMPDERKGKKLVILAERDACVTLSKEEIAERLSPVKIDEFQVVESFNRTDLGKLKS